MYPPAIIIDLKIFNTPLNDFRGRRLNDFNGVCYLNTFYE